MADCFASLPLQSQSIQTQRSDWRGFNKTYFVSSLLDYFFPPLTRLWLIIVWRNSKLKLHADWNISSPPVNQRLSKLFIMRAFSYFPPLDLFCWNTHMVLFVSPCISICLVFALRSPSVTVFSRESHRAFVFMNMGDITLLRQKRKKKKNNSRMWLCFCTAICKMK